MTPYCSERCQRRDWGIRHSSVCHNLARNSRDINKREDNSLPAPAPLRRPHAMQNNQKSREQTVDDDVISRKSGGSEKKYYNNNNINKGRAPQFNRDVGQGRTKDPPVNSQPSPKQVNNSVSTRLPHPKPTPVEDEPVQPPLRKPKPVEPTTPTTPNEPTQPAQPVQPHRVQPARVPPVSVDKVTPVKKLIPHTYLVNELSVGDSFLLSVDAKASECRQDRGDFVCLTMHDTYETHYQKLCEDFILACDQEKGKEFKLIPGEGCAYYNPQDGGWYRARCLTPSTLALIDSTKIVSLSPADICCQLVAQYLECAEFCAVLLSKTAQLGMNLQCTILSKSADSCKVSLLNVETGDDLGEGEIIRWLPTVEYPTQASPTIPEVDRPILKNSSKVLLVEASSLDNIYIRPADMSSQTRYNDVLQNVLIAGMTSTPLTEPPLKGQVVIGKFTDGIHYRALCKRTSAAKNKYLLEYIEFGNMEVQKLEDIYPCPSSLDLESVPTEVSKIVLSTTNTELTEQAKNTIEAVKDVEELILTLPNNASTLPSGSQASLTLSKNSHNFSQQLVQLCTPEWKKMQDNHEDILASPCLMYDQLTFPSLPARGCTIQVTDVSILVQGSICGYDAAVTNHEEPYRKLEKQIEEYCNSEIGRQPYLPRAEELCIAKQPDVNKWRRAVVADHTGGPGGATVYLLYFDSGATDDTPVADVRKMLPELAVLPAMCAEIEIKDFPDPATATQVELAKDFMNIDQNGRGMLNVTRCVKNGSAFICEAPDLIQHINSFN